MADNKHILLRGGSRSGKTFIICRQIILRAAFASGSRHVIFRQKFNHVKQTIGMDTLPAVFKQTTPDIKYELNKTDWVFNLPNGSEIWLAGLDDKERTEKILGSEYATIYFNEISQISYDSVLTARTRLAQKKVDDETKKPLITKCYYDCNPPSTKHWSYSQFIKGVDPVSLLPVGDGYATMLMNPAHNIDNIDPDFIKELENLPEAKRKRFLDGEYVDNVEGALWSTDMIRYKEVLPELKRIVVGVDPSGSTEGDEVGIVSAGICHVGNVYILSDKSGHYSPLTWATISVNELKGLKGDAIVAERNFGGDMVRHTILSHNKLTRVIDVTASRGKSVRAEPVVSLYEQNKVYHANGLHDLENEMITWVPGQGKSPNRVDALVWAVTELVEDVPERTTDPEKVKGMFY